MRKPMTKDTRPGVEAGFTLVEALTAMVILSFGLISIANLFAAATQTNGVANWQTATASVASQQMELLNELPFTTLAAAGAVGNLAADAAGCPALPPNPPGAGNCFFDTPIPPLGVVHTRWTIAPTPAATGGQIVVLTVQAAPTAAGASLVGGRAISTFTTLRACVNTAVGCP
jgi:type II secretory pathway pseudopilin PulG